MNGVALIAFDCRDGRILSTFVYGSVGEPKADEVAGRRERLMSEVAKKLGETDPFDILEIPLRDFPRQRRSGSSRCQMTKENRLVC